MPFKLPLFNELNSTQKLIINLLPKQNKMAVIGGPGTGKTIIALEAASMMAKNKNASCLILSYSKSLKDQISCMAAKSNLPLDNIEVANYHKWFWDALKKLGIEDPKTLASPNDSYRYDLKKLGNVLDTIPDAKKLRYDYMFIDEAQDVQDGLIKIFCQFTKRIFVTFDDCQKIGNEDDKSGNLSYDHSNILNDLRIGDKFYDLIDNYRNTVQTETVARLLFSSYELNDVTLKRVTSSRYGEKPRLILPKTAFNYDVIANYIIDHYDNSKSVAVLIDSTSSTSAYFDSLNEAIKKAIKNSGRSIGLYYKYGNYTNIDSSNALNNGIFLTTFRNSKGLEFDEVFILTTNVMIDNYQKRNAFYVAFTRSKDLTSVFLDRDYEGSEGISNLLLSQKDLFQIDYV